MTHRGNAVETGSLLLKFIQMKPSVRLSWPAAGAVAVALGVAADPEPLAAADTSYVVIVNPANPASAGNSGWLSDVFRKKKVRWENGTAAEPVDLSGEPDVRDAFSADIHGKTTANIRSYWNQEVFSGRATPPLELASSSAVVDYVKTHAGAIGYVSPRAALDGVKALSVIVAPRVVQRVEPAYPVAAMTHRVSGDVVLAVEVSETGSVTKVTPVKEVGMGLTGEAVKAVRKWKFVPGKRDGVAISQEIQVTVSFVLPQ